MPNKKTIDAIKDGDTTALVVLLRGLRYDLIEAAQKHVEMARSAMAKVEEIDGAVEQLGGSDGSASVSGGWLVSKLRGAEPATKT